MKQLLLLSLSLNCLISSAQNQEQILSLNKYFDKLEVCILKLYGPELDAKAAIEKDFDWKFDKVETYSNILKEIGKTAIDYRYFVLVAKLAGGNTFKEPLIGNTYKYLFARLAIERGTNLNNEARDCLKMRIVESYELTRLFAKEGFLNYEGFKNYATAVDEYAGDLIDALKPSKTDLSDFYRTKASILYDLYITAEKDSSKLDDVLLNLQHSMENNPKNRLAIRDRANIRYNVIEDYSGAAEDFIKEYNLRVEENKNPKNFYTKSYPIIEKVGDCYALLDNNKVAISWYSKAIDEINIQTKRKKYYMEMTIEEMRKDEGVFHYKLALCYHYSKTNSLACAELRKAINSGYKVKEMSKMLKEFNCK